MLKIKILYSIIIPHFNTPKLLDICLNNLLKQKYDLNSFEIIVVDDGSNKIPNQIIKKYKSKFRNFLFYRCPKNKGPGNARNIGIKNSNGQYLFFLDCDDSLDVNALQYLKRIIIKKKYEIISFNYKLKNKINKKFMRNDVNLFNVHKIQFVNLFISMNYNNSVIFSIYKKDFLIKNKIKFKNGFHEDILFFFKVFFISKSNFFFNKNLYIKHDRKNSIINTFSKNHIHDYLNSWLEVKKILINYYGKELF